MLCNRTSLGERPPLLSLVACVSPLSEAGFTGFIGFSGVGKRSSLLQRMLIAISQRLLVALATECFYFVNGVLDGNIARWGIRDVDCATGGKLGDEPAIVWGPRFPMDDDGCPADANVGNEVRR